MRTPSARCFRSTATVYRQRPTQGVNAPAGFGAEYYPDGAYATDLPCYVEMDVPPRLYDGQWLVGLMAEAKMFFASNPGFALNDKILWTDAGGVTHQFFVWSVVDMLHQGGPVQVDVQERAEK